MIKKIIKNITPPILITLIKSFSQSLSKTEPEWEYMPAGWKAAETKPDNKGWHDNSIIETYRKKWPDFLNSLKGTKPFGVSYESPEADKRSTKDHNIMITFGYVLAKAALKKEKISFLDWGGGIGHYYLIAKKLMPELAINYTSKDILLMCQHGKEFVPQANFDSTEACLEQKYDLVVSSASLYYFQDWPATLKKLAQATKGYLFITRLPVVKKAKSFVVVQRVYRYGYNTEYLGWCLNQTELLTVAKQAGLELVQQFITGEQVNIHQAPEPCQMLGYLFKPLNQNEN